MAKDSNLDRYVDLGIDLDQWGVEQDAKAWSWKV